MTAYGRVDLAKAFQQATQDELLPDGWERDISAFPADEKMHGRSRCRAEGHECRCASIAGTDGGSADLYPSTHTALSGLGDFEQAGVTVRDKQGAVEGVWSYIGFNLYFSVREHGMRRS